jgi:putative DNA primase/helicase
MTEKNYDSLTGESQKYISVYNNTTSNYLNISQRPEMILLLDNIPNYIKPLKQWLIWKFVWETDKWTKKPLIKWSVPENLYTFEEVIKIKGNDKDIGIGFVLSNSNDIIGIDIDKCFFTNDKGERQITQPINKLMEDLDAYTEVTPSKNGLHIIGRVSDKSKFINKSTILYEGSDHIELFVSDKYLTFTGMKNKELKPDIGFIDDYKITDILTHIKKEISSSDNRFALPIDIKEGGRNDLMFKTACSLRSKGFGETEILTTLAVTNGLRCSPPLSDEELRIIVDSAMKYNPSSPIQVSTNGNIFEEYSQLWLVHEFMNKYKNKYRYVPGSGWYINTDIIWKPDNEEMIAKKVVNKVLKYIGFINETINGLSLLINGVDEENDKKIQKRIDGLRRTLSRLSMVCYPTAVEQELEKLLTLSNEKFNVNLTTINVQNGIFDLDTMKLRDRTENDYNRFVCNFNYDPKAKCPIWEEIMMTILPDEEQRRYIQIFFGYCLSGYIKEEKFMIFTGKGGNGKSTLIVTIADMLSGYSKLAATETFTTDHSNNDVRRAGFEGARYVYCEEIKKYYTLNTEFIKTFASYGSLISARHMRGEPYEYTNTSKFVVSSNFPPQLKDTGDSIRRRLVIVPFKCDVLKTDLIKYKSNLDALLKNEYSGIFNWLLKGYMMWKEEGLILPESLIAYQSEYIDSNEILSEFIFDMIVIQDSQQKLDQVDTRKEVRKSDVYAAYRKWCIYKNEDKPLQKHMFYEELIQSLQKRSPMIQAVRKSDTFYYKGIIVKDIQFPNIKK